MVKHENEVVDSREYLEGHGDLVSRLITPVSHILTPIVPIIDLLSKSPWAVME